METIRTRTLAPLEDGASASGGSFRTNRAGTITMVRSEFPAFSGLVETGSVLRIGLSIGRSAPLVQTAPGVSLSALWRGGTVVVSPPGLTLNCTTGAMAMLGLAIELSMHGQLLAPHDDSNPESWIAAANRLHDDRLLTSVLHAMWCDAELHGASSAFFEHGACLVVSRLRDLAITPPGGRLPTATLRLIDELIEARLDGDLSVVEMAGAIGMEPSGFTRALRATTGHTPYRRLTNARMARAQALLAEHRSVTEVAHSVGYTNASRFAAAFRRCTGVAPSSLRHG